MVVPRAEVAEVFQRVLYPLLETLIDAPANVETTESRLRASVLLCKAFMKFEISDNVAGEDVTECWVRVLEYLGRMMHVDQSEQLVRFTLPYEKCNRILTWRTVLAQSEAVHESIKNAILVMQTAGMLAPLADDPGNEGELWRVTRDKIEQFMPGFMESVVPLSAAAALPSSAEVSTMAPPTAENQGPSPVDMVKPRTSTEPVGGTSIA
jgi:brefeldin A-resistance guanine nucleotide exchange factor 1